MKKIHSTPINCSTNNFDTTIKTIGDFWTLHIIDELHGRELRFCEIERALPAISPATLTNRLKRLENAQIIERRIETHDKQSVAYSLTDRGRGLIPILESIKNYTRNFSK